MPCTISASPRCPARAAWRQSPFVMGSACPEPVGVQHSRGWGDDSGLARDDISLKPPPRRGGDRGGGAGHGSALTLASNTPTRPLPPGGGVWWTSRPSSRIRADFFASLQPCEVRELIQQIARKAERNGQSNSPVIVSARRSAGCLQQPLRINCGFAAAPQ